MKYDWDKLFAKGIFHLHKGEDYNCTTYGVMRGAIQAAGRRGLKVSINMLEGCIKVTVVGKKEPPRGKTKKKAVKR